MSEARRFGSVLDQLREGFQVIGYDWRYIYVNEAVCRQGRRRKEELLGRTMMEMYPGIDETPMFAQLERCMRERIVGETETEFTFPDGSKEWFELRIEPVPEGILVLSLEVGQRKSLESQLRQAQKMEAVGRLAGGIAHDFNNILTAIMSFARFALEGVDSSNPAHQDIHEILNSAGRAETLVRQLLAFSRRQTIEPRVVDMNELVRNLDAMLRRILGEDVHVSTKASAAIATVRIDPGAFEQVLVNLAVNARDAMPEGGKLTVETSTVVLDQSYPMSKGRMVEPGDYVVLSVSDNGCGMDADTKARLFEPFFTTKPRDKGTGLGLSTCYGIVAQAGGYIWVYSEPEKGSTFKIYLPRVDAAPERKRSKHLPDATGGTETILVVEDDPQVRKLAVRSLRRYGYRVMEASDADVALAVCQDTKEEIHLVLTDVIMPRVSGRDLARRLEEMRKLKVLFMSGYTEDAIVSHGVLDAGVHLIQKPFTPDVLARKVREVLDA